MVLTKDGKLLIGNIPTTPGAYKLYVESGILTERVKVAIKTSADWADNVFDKGYGLMTLAQLEGYVKANSHLPGVPSAEKVVKDGVDLGKMDSKLLAKVEELTLYIIDLNKKIERQQRQINQLRKNIKK
jgi:hypothetical protein